MSKPKLVGVTGGMGSGKTTVCKIFETLGASTYYADDRAKSLMTEDEALVNQITDLFGKDAYNDGQLNRQMISERVFQDKELLVQLNEIVHPAVRRDFETWVRSNSNASLLLKEAALLFETGSYKELDYNVLVITDEDARIKRVLDRDPQRDKKSVKAIISQQLTDEQKLPLADFIIDNNGTRSVIKQVNDIYTTLA